jgi:thioredoxin reductase (NADPH)
VSSPAGASAVLSDEQMDLLAANGSVKTAEAGDLLYGIGDASYPFAAIVDGIASIRDAAGNEIVRHGPNGFLGEQNMLSGQAVYVNAFAETDLRYIEVPRETFRELLFENAPFSDLVLSAFIRRREILQQQPGVGIEVVGHRNDPDTLAIADFANRLRIPYERVDPDPDAEVAETAALPLVRLPGGTVLSRPSGGQLSRALGIGRELEPVEQVDLLVVGGGPSGLGAAVYGASEGLDTLLVDSGALGGQAGASRRIENYLGFPGGISGSELASRAVTQARKFHARTATPYRALSLTPSSEPGGRHLVALEDDRRIEAKAIVIATGARYRRLAVDRLEEFEGLSVFYAAGPPEADLCSGKRVGVIGGGNSAAQAAIWLARGGALVTLLHRRADLAETMSDYLIRDLERYGVKVRDRSEISELHGTGGDLEAVTLADGERLPLTQVFLFLGAEPCTEWLDTSLATDDRGFILTGQDAGAAGLLATSVPGIFASGDVRAGSTKRCATAVGEGATAIQLVHEHLRLTDEQAPSPSSPAPDPPE